MPSFHDLHRFVDAALGGEAFRGVDDPNGVWRPRQGSIASIGLLLEADEDIEGWVAHESLQALIVHRPWGLLDVIRGDPGVLAYHLAFDERLTLGMNPILAERIGLSQLEVLGRKEGRPLGMIGAVERKSLSAVVSRIEQEFGRIDVMPGRVSDGVRRVAVVGAMWPELVVEAAKRGAGLYLTGDLRVRGVRAAEETGIAVASAGHRSPEAWGMRTLGVMIETAFPDVRVVLAPALKAPRKNWRSG
jgi:putative NIF3 family GTP cyclohydrolase 1 type 2